jgi:hypothetical protein
MKIPSSLLVAIGALAGALLVSGCASSSPAQSKENLLATAGFKTFPADTPAKQKLLQSLPAGRISTIQRNGKTYYVYPEMASNSALVGTQKEYTNYQQLKNLQQISNRNLQESVDAVSNNGWGAWGGWGGAYGW